MAGKPRKSRPNKIPVALSDASPHNPKKVKRTKRAPMNIGYARVSTTDQTAGLEGQQRDLKAAGAERIFSEKSSSTAQRPTLAECLAFLREGDVLTVTKPDRLARSTAELLSIEADLTQARHRPRGPVDGRRAAGHPQPDQQAHADDPGRCGDLGARDHARAAARRHRQGEGRRQIQGPPAERRPGADQDAAGADGPCGRREDDGDRAVDGLQAVGLTDRAHRAACNVRGAAIGQAQHRQETRPRGGAQMKVLLTVVQCWYFAQ